MNSLHSQFKDFHVFKKFKNLLSSWWNMDVFLLEKKGRDFYLPNQTHWNNKVVDSLMQSSLFKNYFLQAIKELSEKQEPQSQKIYSIKWKQTGLHILAVPLIYNDRLEGYIVSTGFISNKNEQELLQSLDYLKLDSESKKKFISEMRILTETDRGYIQKLLAILAEESFSLIKEKQRQEEILEQIRGEKSLNNYGNLLGKSASMQFLYNVLDKIKVYETPVLIQGENGVGKKLLAKTIHAKSPRANQMFVAQDCFTFNDTILESELFGHKKGGFKEAQRDKKGLFEIANGGTLFLDGIDNISLSLQNQLLRVLQDGTFFPLGETTEKKVDVRIIASTSSDLEEKIERGTFKRELFYKLNIVNIKVPALRDRKEDVSLLVNHFLKEKDPFGKKYFSPEAMNCFFEYSWPGNISQLKNEVEKAVVLSGTEQNHLSADTLSRKIQKNDSSVVKSSAFQFGKQNLKDFLRSIEKEIIMEALQKTNGNKSQVASLLGSSRTSIIIKVKEYGLNKLKNQA